MHARTVWILAIVAVALGGCARGGASRVGGVRAERAHVASSAPAPSSSARAIASPAVGDGGAPSVPPSPCDRLRRAEGLADADTNDGSRFGCWPSAHGVWALRFDPPSDGVPALRTAIHLSGDGAKTTLAAPFDDHHNFSTLQFADSLALFDLDGDGEEEIFFRAQVVGYDATTVDAALLKLDGAKIVAYGPAGKLAIERLYDEDGDRTPDADVIFRLGAHKGCDWCAGSEQSVTLVAHGRPDGTFSFTDERATALLRKRCPTRSRASHVDPKADYVDPARVVCDRLWGAPRAQIVAQLRRDCAPYAKAAAECQGPCRNLDQAIQYADFAPPATLR